MEIVILTMEPAGSELHLEIRLIVNLGSQDTPANSVTPDIWFLLHTPVLQLLNLIVPISAIVKLVHQLLNVPFAIQNITQPALDNVFHMSVMLNTAVNAQTIQPVKHVYLYTNSSTIPACGNHMPAMLKIARYACITLKTV